jgi:putative ABC transport system permease protein
MLRMLLAGMLAANRLRLALTVACIALGVALAGAVHSIHSSALAEIDRAAHLLSGTADVEIRGPRSGFDERVFLDVARRPEVAAANPIVDVDAALVGDGAHLRVLGIDPLRAVRLQPAFVAEEGRTGIGDATRLMDLEHAWLSPAAAARLRLGEGDRLRLVAGTSTLELKVAGVLPRMETVGDLAVIDIAVAQSAFGRVGLVSRIDLRLRPGVDARRARAELASMLPKGVLAAEAASTGPRAEEISRAYRVNLDALALVALATGAFLAFSTLALHAARRRQELALLRALGLTRRGLAALLALEGALLGAAGSVVGTLLGIAAARALLKRIGPDLGAGYFSEASPFEPNALALAGIAAIGIGMCAGAAWWIARALQRMDIAEALRDRSADLPRTGAPAVPIAIALALGGIPLLLLPPLGELPLGGYGAIGAWLLAAVVAVAPLARAALRHGERIERPLAFLALSQVRHLPGHLAASVAGIVVSAALCVAMAIMVFSFRVSLEDWLAGVVSADLYVRSGGGGESGFLTLEEQRRIAALPEVASIEPLRYDRLALAGQAAPLSLVARPVDARILRGFHPQPSEIPPPSGDVNVWISEAARDLEGWRAGERVRLAIAGKEVEVRVAGVIRDYARTWGAVIIPLEEYRRITGETRAHDLALHLARGVDPQAAEAAIRRALPQAQGLVFEEAGELRRRSLEIFDRSFAVTYALEAAAIAIGLAGVTSSFAALAWSRRREFGVLRFLGLRRGDVLRLLVLEGAATGALGALIGLAAGAAISVVLVQVVNRQSFHWTLEMHWPVGTLAALLAAIVALCAFGARASGALAVRAEAVAAVKDDA